MLLRIIIFILVFGLIVVVHEFGHFYFARRSGILVREFSIGMGPKIFDHTGKDGVAYTIRILPLGGYVRMAGWGDDTTEIPKGAPATITLNDQGIISRINLSDKKVDRTALPVRITAYDLEKELSLTALVDEDSQIYAVDHDATIVETDGTEVRIAPQDVQYQNASILGRLITNFAGPMNNFILGLLLCIGLVFLQGGVQDTSLNTVQVTANGAAYQAGLRSGDQIIAINGKQTENWSAIQKSIVQVSNDQENPTVKVAYRHAQKETTKNMTLRQVDGHYVLGISVGIRKTNVFETIAQGAKMAWNSAFAILNALRSLILQPSLNKLGGPVAMYQMIGTAAENGLTSIIYLTAMISINLGIVNLMPIPALDGGKIVLNLLEAIRRKPLRQETETIVTLVGVAVMALLMVAVTWNDIVRAFF